VEISSFEKQGEGGSDPLEKCAPSADREITPRILSPVLILAE
jgi:hypothetical protein